MKFSRSGTVKAKAVGACLAAIIAVTALFMAAVPATATMVGVTPPFLTIDNALRGTTYEEYITIFNTDTQINSYGLSSDNISGWVSYYLPESPDTAITSIDVPAQSTQRILVKIAIPADTPNGPYDGQLIITAMTKAPGEGEGSNVSVGMQVPVIVNITVTGTQNISGRVNDILASDVEVGYPLRLIVMFENTGNVAAAPLIEVTITYKGQKVASFSGNSTKAAAGKVQNIEVEWDTTGNAPAAYTARVAVSLDGKALMQKEVTFNILPLGSLTRSGELKDIVIDNAAIVSKPLKVQATFANTGQIDTNVYFTGEVYLAGNLIQVMTSDTLLVKHGEQEVLTAYFTPEQAGDLNIKVQATFEGKKSDIKEININAIALHDMTPTLTPTEGTSSVGTSNEGTQSATAAATTTHSSVPIYAAVGAVVVVVAGIFGFGAIRNKKLFRNKTNGNGGK